MSAKPLTTKKKTVAKAKRKPVKKSAPVATQSTAVTVRTPMPKLVAMTKETFRTLWVDKALFGRLFLITMLAALLLFGATQQSQYVETTTALDTYSKEVAGEGLNATVRYGVLLAAAVSGGLNTSLSETQRVYLFFLYLLVWLVTVWLLRHRLAGTRVIVRDGLYNAGAPVVPVLILFFLGALQLLPMAIGVIVYSAAVTSGMAQGVFEVGLFMAFALALSIASLYWLSSTVVAVMIATNPGAYPWKALRAAKKVVTGRRTKLMIHLLWLILLLVLLWACILVPGVVLDNWLHQPFIPLAMLSTQVLTSSSIIFASAYIYLLYRKMIDEPAE